MIESSFSHDWMHISTPCSVSGKRGMGAEAGWGRSDGRCRQTGGICFGTSSVPETGRKLREQAEKPLPWGSFCPKSPPPPPLTKNINNKRPCFPFLLGGEEKELSWLEKNAVSDGPNPAECGGKTGNPRKPHRCRDWLRAAPTDRASHTSRIFTRTVAFPGCFGNGTTPRSWAGHPGGPE